MVSLLKRRYTVLISEIKKSVIVFKSRQWYLRFSFDKIVSDVTIEVKRLVSDCEL